MITQKDETHPRTGAHLRRLTVRATDSIMRAPGACMTLDEFFDGWEESREVFDALRGAVEASGAADIGVTKSQVAFRRRRAFAWAWVPDRYLGGGHTPLVLSLALGYRNASPHWKQIVEPARGRFKHHLELHSAGEIDDEVRAWLREAWASAT